MGWCLILLFPPLFMAQRSGGGSCSNYPNPLLHPAIFRILHTGLFGKRKTRLGEGARTNFKVSPSSLTLPLSSVELSDLYNFKPKPLSRAERISACGRTQYKSTRSEHLGQPLQMTHRQACLLPCTRIPLLPYAVSGPNKTTADRMMTIQVAIHVLHCKPYWYNCSILFHGASDRLTNWWIVVLAGLTGNLLSHFVNTPCPRRWSKGSLTFPSAHWIGWFAPQGLDLEGKSHAFFQRTYQLPF